MSPAPPVVWEPDAATVASARLTRYLRWLGDARGLVFDDYDALQRWSADDLDAFWQSIWDHFEVAGDRGAGPALARRQMPGAEWFPGARLNYAEQIFAGRDADAVAVLHAGERRSLRETTWGQLREQVAGVATGLLELGVQPGDAVVAYLPNCVEAVAAMLACASIGAVWSSASPDFGPRAVVDRFAQLEPKVLLAVDGYRYGGRDFDRLPVVARLQASLPTVDRTVLLPYLDAEATLDGTTSWAELTARRSTLTFDRMPFDHPLWVLWSSGTTGLPKGLVQGHGGILLEQLKSQHLHLDAHPGDRVLWFTTTGWMMWNYLVGCLLTGSAIVLYDGNPGTPDLNVLWDLAERTATTHFGTSASYIAACMKSDVRPRGGRDLAALRAVGSTGSPLAADGFTWINEQLGDMWLFSMSGGSDVCTAFVGGCPLVPVHRGELQRVALGAKLEAWDHDGRAVVGQVGELVLTEPMPSMPLRLVGDPTGERYREAYFGMWPGVWRHGDWVELTERGSAVIHGRSDATINRGGIRMGTSEIYASVLACPEVREALVVDVQMGNEAWMPLFVVLADDALLDDRLQVRIVRRIRSDCSPRHVPDEIHAVPAIPRTLTGKVLEVPVKRLLMGADRDGVAARDVLEDPTALDWFADFASERLRGTRAAR